MQHSTDGDRYPTIDEVAEHARRLAARFPRLCRLRRLADSRSGQPLWLLSVGGGGRNCLVVAGAHANERVGGATAVALAERVATDETLHAERDTTWHFLLCLDPDGTRLNEAPSPRTLAGYHRSFFRPEGAEQPEWAPSVRPPGDELPETRALLDLVDELQPFLQCSLHGHDIGGGWVQLTRPLPGLGEPFAKVAAVLDVPIEHGAFDTLLWSSPAPGVFVAPEAHVREQFPTLVEDVAGSTWGAPHRYGGLTAAIEVPMWASDAVGDRSPHPSPHAAFLESAERLRAEGRTVGGLLDEARRCPLVEEGPMLRAVQAALAGCSGLAGEWERLARNDAHRTLASLTRGHVVASQGLSMRIPLRAAAMLLRLLESGRQSGEPSLHEALAAYVHSRCGALESAFRPRWVPLDEQVRFQSQTVVEVFRSALSNHGAHHSPPSGLRGGTAHVQRSSEFLRTRRAGPRAAARSATHGPHR